MTRRARPRTGLAIAALALAATAGAVPIDRAAAAGHDQLVIGVSQFPATLHPDINPEAIKGYVVGFGLRPITAHDKDWKNGCLQCTELPSLRNGLARLEGGGLAVTVRLKPGMKWGDGVPVTASDLAFTWKVGRDPASGFIELPNWRRVARIEVIDDLTAVMHFSETWTLFDRLPDMLPEHLEGPIAAAARAPGDYARQTLYARRPATAGLYSGPYVVATYDPAGLVILEPNPFWNGRRPAIRRIVIRGVGNTAALQANLMSGDVDLIPGDAPSLTLDQVLALRRQYPDRWTYRFRPALTYEHVDLNLDNPILADPRVRRALLLALDRRTMAHKLFDDVEQVASSFLNPLDPMYFAGIAEQPYDPAAARALLAEAGWHPGGDGICRNAAGERLDLEFVTTAGNRMRELVQQVMKDQWRAVGVQATIRNQQARVLFGETLAHRRFTGLAMYAWSSPISDPPRQTLASDQIPSAANDWAGSNHMGFRDPAMDAAITVAETDLDPAHQQAAWAAMQRIYAERLPVLPLFFGAEAYVLPKWLHGLEPTGHTANSSLWAEDWLAE